LLLYHALTPTTTMATTASRPYASYATSHKTLPITMPSKTPAYHYPVSRVALSPPEMSDSSTYSGSRSSGRSYSALSNDYDSYSSASGVDVVDMLSDRMNTAFDPIRMDQSLARQAQT
jgi:biogenesis of lysosome-related organelles complex 1 subunit KXD1